MLAVIITKWYFLQDCHDHHEWNDVFVISWSEARLSRISTTISKIWCWPLNTTRRLSNEDEWLPWSSWIDIFAIIMITMKWLSEIFHHHLKYDVDHQAPLQRGRRQLQRECAEQVRWKGEEIGFVWYWSWFGNKLFWFIYDFNSRVQVEMNVNWIWICLIFIQILYKTLIQFDFIKHFTLAGKPCEAKHEGRERSKQRGDWANLFQVDL